MALRVTKPDVVARLTNVANGPPGLPAYFKELAKEAIKEINRLRGALINPSKVKWELARGGHRIHPEYPYTNRLHVSGGDVRCPVCNETMDSGDPDEGVTEPICTDCRLTETEAAALMKAPATIVWK